MVPTLTGPDPRDRGADPPLDPGSPDALAAELAGADAPFRAWAAVALHAAASPGHREEGRRLAGELRDRMPPAADLQHADLAAYALLDGAGLLPAVQGERLRDALPLPHGERPRRSRLYRSGVYVYMVARGAAAAFAHAAGLVRAVEDELARLSDRASPDLVDLALLLAARLELAPVAPVADGPLRRAAGRVAGGERSPQAALALHWLIELYAERWPPGEEAAALREAIRS